MSGKQDMSNEMKLSQTWMDIDDIKKIMDNDEISVISFDLFDTLLVRPSIEPRDIFYLLRDKVTEKYGLDIVKLRVDAEEELGMENASLNDIWEYIAQKNHIDDKIVSELMREETDIELSLLTVRKDVREIYEYAVQLGKRIIVVSDMYLSSDILRMALEKNGYNKVSEIYVSNECKARKDGGELYDYVLKKENIRDHSRMMHIGDNPESDFKTALEKGITAVYYPSVWDMVLRRDSQWRMCFTKDPISDDPYFRLLYSFAFLYMYNNNKERFLNKAMFADIEGFCGLFLAPLLAAVVLDILNDADIHKTYRKIYFAARDGYLPQKVYDIFSEDKNELRSEYIYVSRQALCYSTYKDFFEYYDNMEWGYAKYRLENFLNYVIVDNELKHRIINSLADDEKNIDLHDDYDAGREVLLRFKTELNEYFQKQKELSRSYYRSLFSAESERELVFDCGYSGSVSKGLGSVYQNSKRFDKYYLWETEKNRKRDKKDKTRTKCFFSGDLSIGMNVVLEECFSPCVGSCLGFKQAGESTEPVIDELYVSEAMALDMSRVEKACLDFAEAFSETFSEYFKSFRVADRQKFTDIFYRGFLSSPYSELDMFKNIRFVDSNIGGEALALSAKIYDILDQYGLYGNPFSGTGFDNPDMVLKTPLRSPMIDRRIGIHFHLYNKFIYEEFFSYMKYFPYKFDLIITITDPKAENVVKKVFSDKTIPQLDKLIIIKVVNRGRDIAPWIVATRKLQDDYDYFCHIHSKTSVYMGVEYSDMWREHLFKNLLGVRAVTDIFSAFEDSERLGAVFPQPFENLRNMCIQNNITQFGEFGEIDIINDLLKRMNINKFQRSDLLFSEGSMLWYRPAAMKPLFDLGLQTEDFPEEPIGVGGTIAHAIERMVSIVPESRGYYTRMYQPGFGGQTIIVGSCGVIGLKGALRNYLRKKLNVKLADFLCKILRL